MYTTQEEMRWKQLEEKIPCQICNIYIPINFMKPHEKSKLHKTNLKIANIANEGLMKLANEGTVSDTEKYYDDTDEDNHVLTYFCDVCVEIIQVHEVIHNESEIHKKNKTNIDNLVRLSKIYRDENFINHEFLNSDVQYIEYIARIHRVKHLEVIDDDTVMIKAINGDKIKLKYNDFHSIMPYITSKKDKKFNYQCMLCYKNISSFNDHIVELQHIINIKEPFANKNCITKCDDNGFSYCLVCQVRVRVIHVKIHTNTDEHKKNVRIALISENKEVTASSNDDTPDIELNNTPITDNEPNAENAQNTDDESSTDNAPKINTEEKQICAPSKTNLPEIITYKEIQDYVNHIEMLYPVTHSVEFYLESDHVDIKTSNGNSVTLSMSTFYGITTVGSPPMLYCLFCKHYVKESKLEHMYSEHHIEYVAPNIMDEHCIRFILHENNVGEAYCLHCKCRFYESVREHKLSEKHINNMNHWYKFIRIINFPPKINYEVINDSKDNRLLCRICQVPFPGTESSAQIHVSGARHNRMKQQFMSENQLRPYLMDYECMKCETFVLARFICDHIGSH